MFYFARHPKRPLVLVFGPKGACQSLRKWFSDTLKETTGNSSDISPFLVPPRSINRLRDHHKVLVLRDPLCRLVSFYCNYVVADPRTWCFADHEQRFPLHQKSFRQLLFVLNHLHWNRLRLQHHLEPQCLGLDGLEFDEVLCVERLEQGIDSLNRRFGFTSKIQRLNANRYRSLSREPAGDRSPAWFREHGLPRWQHFYDDESTDLTNAIYERDIALYRGLVEPVDSSDPEPAGVAQ
jgi:hypothetical protein